MRRLALVLAALLAAPAATAVARPQAQITVFAAASLTDAFQAVDRAPRFSFGSSNALATQIRNGAPADVFASANTEIPAQLHAQGFVDKPVNFTRNALVVVVPKSNPAGIKSVYDLTNPGVKIVVAGPAVPVGIYTNQILRNMNLTARVASNLVSHETDVREVLAKIAVGQADAGFVYATDAKTVADRVAVVRLPAWAQPKVTYAMAVVSRSPNKAGAQAFIRKVLGKAGQAKLQAHGFLPVTKPRPRPKTTTARR